MNLSTGEQYFDKINYFLTCSCNLLRLLVDVNWELETGAKWKSTEECGKRLLKCLGSRIRKSLSTQQKSMIEKGSLEEWDLSTLSLVHQHVGKNQNKIVCKQETDAVKSLIRVKNEMSNNPKKTLSREEFNMKYRTIRRCFELFGLEENLTDFANGVSMENHPLVLDQFRKLLQNSISRGSAPDEVVTVSPAWLPCQPVIEKHSSDSMLPQHQGTQEDVKDIAEYASMELFERQNYIASLKKENQPQWSSGGQSQSQNLESDFDRVNKFIDHANRLLQMFSLKESKDFSVAEVSEIVNIMYEGAIHGYDALKPPKPIVDRLNILIRQLSDNSKSKKKVSCSVEDMKLRLIYIRFTLSGGSSDSDKKNKLKSAMVGLQMYPENPEYHSLVSSLYGTITADETGFYYAKQGLKRFPSHAGLLLLKAAYLATLQTDCTEDPQLVVDAYENYLRAIPFDHWRVPQTYYIMAYRYLLMAVGQPSSEEHAIKLIKGYYSLAVEAEKLVHPLFHGHDKINYKMPIEQFMLINEYKATQLALCISRIKLKTDNCTTTANSTLRDSSGIERQGKSQTSTTTHDAFEATVSTKSKPVISAADAPNDDPAVDNNATAPACVAGLLPQVPLALHGNLLNLDLIDQLPQQRETETSALSLQNVFSICELRTSAQTFHSEEHIPQCQGVGECFSLPEEKDSEIDAQAEIQDSVLEAEASQIRESGLAAEASQIKESSLEAKASETTKRRKLSFKAVSFLRQESGLEEETSPIQESVLESDSQIQGSSVEAEVSPIQESSVGAEAFETTRRRKLFLAAVSFLRRESVLEARSQIQESGLEAEASQMNESGLEGTNDEPLPIWENPNYKEKEPVPFETEPPIHEEGQLEPELNLQRLPQAVVLPENKFTIAAKLPLYCMAIYCFAQGHFVIAILTILYVLFYLSGPRD